MKVLSALNAFQLFLILIKIISVLKPKEKDKENKKGFFFIIILSLGKPDSKIIIM